MLPNKKVLLVNFEKISSGKLAFQITEETRSLLFTMKILGKKLRSSRNIVKQKCIFYFAMSFHYCGKFSKMNELEYYGRSINLLNRGRDFISHILHDKGDQRIFDWVRGIS